MKTTKNKKVPIRYVPKTLSKKDRNKQAKMLKKSQNLYKKHKYYVNKLNSSVHFHIQSYY
jgi:hypothetical protein